MRTATSKTLSAPGQNHALAEAFAIAAVVVGRVLEGESLTRAMADFRVSGPLRAAVQDLAYSALREYGRVDLLLAQLVKRPPAVSLRGLLMVALVELQLGPQSDHAVVHQAVEAVARIAPRGGVASRGLINAVLRNFLRQRDSLLAEVNAQEIARYRHPQWWIDCVRKSWPQHWEGILAAGNGMPPMTLRINQRRTDAARYLERLQARSIEGILIGPHAIQLHKAVPVERLPGFSAGDVSVQDWGAQQAAFLLDVQAGMRVLDACAAPGGKTTHIAELAECSLTAMEFDATRAERVKSNLQRLHLQAEVMVGDALCARKIFAEERFDRILADVPCTASGIVRRHPDIKWLRRESDTGSFSAKQRSMLEALWQVLAPGGKLLYATCSVFPEENIMQVETFLGHHADASCIAVPAIDSLCKSAGQILPNDTSDGFFYALLQKRG